MGAAAPVPSNSGGSAVGGFLWWVSSENWESMREGVERVLKDLVVNNEVLKIEGNGGNKLVEKGATAIGVNCEISFTGDEGVVFSFGYVDRSELKK